MTGVRSGVAEAKSVKGPIVLSLVHIRTVFTAGPLLDDAEKGRLAEWMRYRGKPPECKVSAQPRKAQVATGSKAELQRLFDEIVLEINERQTFLEEMAALSQTNGKAYQTQSNQIKREIAERVQEMKRIDQMLHHY